MKHTAQKITIISERQKLENSYHNYNDDGNNKNDNGNINDNNNETITSNRNLTIGFEYITVIAVCDAIIVASYSALNQITFHLETMTSSEKKQ